MWLANLFVLPSFVERSWRAKKKTFLRLIDSIKNQQWYKQKIKWAKYTWTSNKSDENVEKSFDSTENWFSSTIEGRTFLVDEWELNLKFPAKMFREEVSWARSDYCIALFACLKNSLRVGLVKNEFENNGTNGERESLALMKGKKGSDGKQKTYLSFLLFITEALNENFTSKCQNNWQLSELNEVVVPSRGAFHSGMRSDKMRFR